MSALDVVTEASLHLETAFTILHGVFTQVPRGRLEADAGISRGYLRRLERSNTPPSPRLAESIAKATPLPLEQQRDLYEEFCQAHVILLPLAQLRADLDWLRRNAISELIRAHRLAVYAANSSVARTYYRAMQSLGSALLPEFYRRSLVLPAAQTHILLHDVLSVFNRPGAALFHARAATTLLKLYTPDFADSVLRYELFEPRLEPANEEHHEGMIDHGDLFVNAVRSENR